MRQITFKKIQRVPFNLKKNQFYKNVDAIQTLKITFCMIKKSCGKGLRAPQILINLITYSNAILDLPSSYRFYIINVLFFLSTYLYAYTKIHQIILNRYRTAYYYYNK